MPAEAVARPTPWGRVAGLYDLQLPLEARALDAAIELAATRSDERLLDLATGTGALLRRLARRRDPPSHAVGVDASAAMLARAHRRPTARWTVPARARRLPLAWSTASAGTLPPAWQLRVADARALLFDDATFDVVTAAYLLHLLEPSARRDALAEAHRVLRPGGRLVVVTVAAPPRGALAPAWAALARSGRRASGIIAGMRTLDPRAEIAEAGFDPRRARIVTRGYPSLVVLAERKR